MTVTESGLLPSVLSRCWLGSGKGIRPVRNWPAWLSVSVWGDMQICV